LDFRVDIVRQVVMRSRPKDDNQQCCCGTIHLVDASIAGLEV
jgi:hypothetical protein